jgi:hypothetical protein
MTTVWVYPTENYWIVKRRPFQYSAYVQDPVDGDISYRIITGNEITCPLWEQIVRHQGFVYGVFKGQVYDVTDLYTGA